MSSCRKVAWRIIFSEVRMKSLWNKTVLLKFIIIKSWYWLYKLLWAGSPNIEPLSWDLRIRIAIGAARGLAFLHSSEKHIIYRDFKASNILLDGVSSIIQSQPFKSHSLYWILLYFVLNIFCWYLLQNYNAKISDFGLAKLGPTGGDSHVSTRVMGTYGYAAPEYIATGNVSEFHIWCICVLFDPLSHHQNQASWFLLGNW